MKKNLLYVFADQWRGSALGFAGEEAVLTPNIDRFCREAVYCDHTFSAFPLCSPHRASLLTGRYPLSTGFFTNCKTGTSLRLADHEVGIGQVLKKAGYQTAYIGKWHLDEPERNYNPNPESGARDWDAFTPPGIRRHGFDFWYSYGAWDAHLHPHYWRDTPAKIQVDEWSVEHETGVALEYLKEAGRKDKPFALFLSWNPPHSPYGEVPEEYYNIYKDKNIPLRGNVRWDHIHHHTGEETGYNREELAEVTRQYYGAISGLDHQFGRLIAGLKDQGLYEDTLIILSSDHGDMMGSHGLMGKHVWYEESVRIPYIVRYPGCRPHVCHTCMASQDMMPTILGLLSLDIPGTVEGEDCSHILMEEKEEPDRVSFLCACPGRRDMIEEFARAGKNPMAYGWRAVRSRRYTFVADVGYHPEAYYKEYLYDNEADPLQRKPLDPGDGACREVADELRQMLKQWTGEQKDGFLWTEEGGYEKQ